MTFHQTARRLVEPCGRLPVFAEAKRPPHPTLSTQEQTALFPRFRRCAMAKPRPSRTALLFQGRPRYDSMQTAREGLASFPCKRETWQRPRFVSPPFSRKPGHPWPGLAVFRATSCRPYARRAIHGPGGLFFCATPGLQPGRPAVRPIHGPCRRTRRVCIRDRKGRGAVGCGEPSAAPALPSPAASASSPLLAPLSPEMPGNLVAKAFDGLRKRRTIRL